MALGKLIICAALALALSACMTGERIAEVRAGMSKDQVLAVLGRPDGFAQNGASETLTYSNRIMSGFSWDRADYHVVLSSGVVTSYGPGTVRQNSSPVSTAVVIPIR